ncbi:MAG: AraC family transcriptional regulator ligand-binding domain-containing protein, partial [Polyangiaceae bacterium]
MAAGATQRAHTLPAAYVIPLLDLVKRWEVDETQLLPEFGLAREALTAPGESIPLDVAIALYERAVALTCEPGLGIYLGLQMRVSAHGILGFAAISADDVRQAILLAVKYMAIRITALSMRTHVAGGAGALVLEEHVDLGAAREAYPFAILVGLWSMGGTLAGRPLDATLDFAFPRPPYFERFARALPPTRFDQPQHQIVLRDLALLEQPLPMADAASLRLAKDQCDQLLQSMGLDGRLAPRARSVLARHADGVQSLVAVARALSLSTRTFRRRLEAEGLTFSELADEERRRRALLLLRSKELSVQQVGERLGYSDVANFTRAFRRWTG